MKKENAFKTLNKFELGLWIASTITIILSFILSPDKDLLSLTSSLIGATALIFLAKGYVLGQVLTVVFSLFYGVVSFFFQYYGEMITYLGMTAPMAALAVVSWSRNRVEGEREVRVRPITAKTILGLIIATPIVTLVFYFVLRALGNANMLFSTISVATSFIASYLTFFRSPYYALAYAANDIVLIVLWVMAAIREPYCIPMIFCFVTFLFNDMYAFYNWRRMKKRQEKSTD